MVSTCNSQQWFALLSHRQIMLPKILEQITQELLILISWGSFLKKSSNKSSLLSIAPKLLLLKSSLHHYHYHFNLPLKTSAFNYLMPWKKNSCKWLAKFGHCLPCYIIYIVSGFYSQLGHGEKTNKLKKKI